METYGSAYLKVGEMYLRLGDVRLVKFIGGGGVAVVHTTYGHITTDDPDEVEALAEFTSRASIGPEGFHVGDRPESARGEGRP